MLAVPPRYEAKSKLGRGGGGEVWRVFDRVRGEMVALKVLAKDAGEQEAISLVREAVALSSLEGLGLPRVLAFGSLEDKRRFMVREMVEGESLEALFEREAPSPWLLGLVQASEQLTVLHRSGLLHGDIKPANIIVSESGAATLVDLGLSAKWKEGGVAPEGLTPRFAAPELLAGEALTVRAEVFSLGATLAEGLREASSFLDLDTCTALLHVAERATSEDPKKRFPSVDEFATAVRSVGHLPRGNARATRAWQVHGLDPVAHLLLAELKKTGKGGVLFVEGPRGSGRSTLLRRVGWSLGVSGERVCTFEVPTGKISIEEALELEIGAWRTSDEGGVIVADDVDRLSKASVALLVDQLARGVTLVCTSTTSPEAFSKFPSRTFKIPALDEESFRALVLSSIPSIPEPLIADLDQRTGRRPGALRDIVERVGDRPVVSAKVLDEASEGPSTPQTRAQHFLALERALATGHFDEAANLLDELGHAADPSERLRIAIATSRLMLARGDGTLALSALSADLVAGTEDEKTTLDILRGRALVRLGDFAGSAEVLARATAKRATGALGSEAFAVRGIAFAYLGDEARAEELLKGAVSAATSAGDPRAIAIATGSMAIAHQRAGRAAKAREAYITSLTYAEQAGDAWTIAATRLNLAGLAQGAGDFAEAFVHLEAAVDLGLRAGGLLAVQQARLNLANLDIFVGRFARANAALQNLSNDKDHLTSGGRAQLLGLQAELSARTGNDREGARLYDLSADAYDAIARPLDAAEVRLEAILCRAKDDRVEGATLLLQIDAAKAHAGDSGFGEHQALFHLVKGTVLARMNRETEAKLEMDAALTLARERGQSEWGWRVLHARGQLQSARGSLVHGKNDIEEALGLLEETASKLPRDLREVFWSTPQRRALREATTATILGKSAAVSIRDHSSTTGTLPTEDRLARIFEITRELAREHEVQRLLERVTDHAVALVEAERGLVVLVQPNGELTITTSRDSKGEESHAKFSRSVAERVIQSGEPVVVTSAQEDERVAQAVSVHQLMIQSIACVPIRGAPPVGRPIGALYVETRLRPGSRFKKELPTLLAFADQAAIAIENARLLEENEARTDQLEEANRKLARAQERLEEALGRRTEQLAETRKNLKQVRAEIGSHFGYGKLVGTSAPMRRMYAIVERVKDTDVPLLLIGESGTGKEVVAQSIHTSGARAKSPFLGVNCGAIPANLLESELFGHVKGAFTGADRDRSGLFREASGGTILLDEIGEMPLSMQAGLLRVLQERTVRPVGATAEMPVDTRVIAATNRNLQKMVEAGTFREDLYYRLNVIEIAIPPLRERPDDIPALLDHFLSLFSVKHRRERKTLSRDALKRLTSYTWPGNVRQLEHVLLNAWLMSDDTEIEADDISLPQRSSTSEPRPSSRPAARNPDEFEGGEKKRILEALESCGWNRAKAAQIVGLPRRTFYRRLKEYGIL